MTLLECGFGFLGEFFFSKFVWQPLGNTFIAESIHVIWIKFGICGSRNRQYVLSIPLCNVWYLQGVGSSHDSI